MGLTVTVEAKSKVGESSSTGNNLELEILDNANIYSSYLKKPNTQQKQIF